MKGFHLLMSSHISCSPNSRQCRLALLLVSFCISEEPPMTIAVMIFMDMNHGINSLNFQTKQHSMKKKTNFQSIFCCHVAVICHCSKLETPVSPQKTVTTFQLAHITLKSQLTSRTLSHFLERKWGLYFTGTWSNMSERGGRVLCPTSGLVINL